MITDVSDSTGDRDEDFKEKILGPVPYKPFLRVYLSTAIYSCMEALKHSIDQWLLLDKNHETRAEIQDLWDARNIVELENRMNHRIEFGTAGLRGKMEAGWSRMNDLIVIQTSQGLAEYILSHVQDAAVRGVVIGHDHRHNSLRWAQLTASAFIAKGMKVYLFSELVHTPMVPFAVGELSAACGVMITASHNPKDDNGYKVYWENAVQIIGPHDKEISDSIGRNLKPITWSLDGISSSLCVDKTEELRKAYFLNLLQNLSRDHEEQKSTLKFVNTSMHGVSDSFIKQGFELFGFPPYIPVKEQQLPDPDFPTVKFPNPEEKGALDFALATADREGASYVLAQDPDSDRFSAAERSADGNWTMFTGDQLGTLFVDRVVDTYKLSGKPLDKLAIVASTVSSKMIEAMAKVEGFKFVECLTGFKFIGNTALGLVTQGYDVPFGYEEAIGYMFGPSIRDKDGVAATMNFVQLVNTLHSQGKTAKSHLLDLYERYGFFQLIWKTSNGYFICNDSSIIGRIFERIRNFEVDDSNTKPSYPKIIGGLSVTRVVDLTTGYDSSNPPAFKPDLPLSSGHMIQFRAENKETGMKIVLTTRTSGTEPKIKYYLEGSGKDTDSVAELLPKVTKELGEVWFEAAKYNLLRS